MPVVISMIRTVGDCPGPQAGFVDRAADRIRAQLSAGNAYRSVIRRCPDILQAVTTVLVDIKRRALSKIGD